MSLSYRTALICPVRQGGVSCRTVSVFTVCPEQVYQVQVTRGQSEVMTLFRRYSEFDELHSRLSLCFPGDTLPNFPGKTYLPGKSRARETVEKRLSELNRYVSELLKMEARISEVSQDMLEIRTWCD